jgi:outer membrane assembly lipoprotein YfiO
MAGRIAMRDVAIDDYVIPKGERCGLMFAAANRDPRKWPDPERFDIRRDLRGHVGWGYGIHACVGRVLALLEAEALLSALARHIERFEPAGEPEPWMTTIGHGPGEPTAADPCRRGALSPPATVDRSRKATFDGDTALARCNCRRRPGTCGAVGDPKAGAPGEGCRARLFYILRAPKYFAPPAVGPLTFRTMPVSVSKTLRLLAVPCACALVLVAGCRSRGGEVDIKGSPEFIYKEAKKDLDSANWQAAVQKYELLEARFPFSDPAKQGQLDLMYAYYRNHENESAIDQAEQFIRENPTHPRVDYAHYIKGLTYFQGGANWLERVFHVDINKRPPQEAKQAFQSFQTLTQQYPNSPYAADARLRMIYVRNRPGRLRDTGRALLHEAQGLRRCREPRPRRDRAVRRRPVDRRGAQHHRVGLPQAWHRRPRDHGRHRSCAEPLPDDPVSAKGDKPWWRFW